MSGYDLVQTMKISLDSLWAATYSQIYPALHKMEADGWVKGHKGISQKGRERIEYSLTESGREALKSWINDPVGYLPYRDPFKLWATNIDRCSIEQIKANVHLHIEINTRRVATFLEIAQGIENESHPLIRERIQTVPRSMVDQIKKTRAPIFRMLAKQAQFEITCAEELLKIACELHEST
jgi:DNA-binding PadR family transcriptional regulator